MACSENQEEQVENLGYYLDKKWCQKMDECLDIDILVDNNVTKQQREITSMIDAREERIIKLIEELA